MQASAAALWINTVFAGFDQSITTAVHNLYLWAGDFFTPFFEFISFLGHDGIILVLLSIALMLFKRTRRFGTSSGCWSGRTLRATRASPPVTPPPPSQR